MDECVRVFFFSRQLRHLAHLRCAGYTYAYVRTYVCGPAGGDERAYKNENNKERITYPTYGLF